MGLSYSVITVCLNSGKTIERTIRSVLSQSVLPKEYIFVDGGSTDTTLDTIRQHTATVNAGAPTNFIIRQQVGERGITAAWNMALAGATGDVVFILNSDDWYEPETAEAVLKRFRENPNVGIVCGYGRVVDAETGTFVTVRKLRSFRLIPILMPIVHPACFVHNRVYREVGSFDTRYTICADYEFIYRCHNAGVKFLSAPEVIVNIQLGGFGDRNRNISRVEHYSVAKQHSGTRLLPALSMAARWITGR